MIRTALLAASFAAIATPAASAQVSVIGGGIARDCYEAALYGRVSNQEGERICTRAIESELMKMGNRAATYTNRGVLRMRSGGSVEVIYVCIFGIRVQRTYST